MSFAADFFPIRSRFSISSALREYRSAASRISPASSKSSTICGPRPSIFIAPLDAKCSILRDICAGQATFVHLIATPSPSSLNTGSPQEGQAVGILNSTSLPSRLSVLALTTSGMMSPALRTTTTSPSIIPLSRIKSRLWSVARLTVVPASLTGARTAVGVRTPVLPTAIVISSSRVSFSSGGNLYATAHLGVLVPSPSVTRSESLFIFITTPSISYARESRIAPSFSIWAIISSALWTTAVCSRVLKPREDSVSSVSECRVGEAPFS